MTANRSTLAHLAPDEKRRLLAELLRTQSSGTRTRAGVIDEVSIHAHRRLFPALAGKGYFNYGARGPVSQPVLDAIQDALQETERVGPFSHEALVLQERAAESLRATLAGMYSVGIDAVALAESTTAACNVAFWGVDWRPGDHLLLSDCEHLSAVAVAQAVRDRFGVRLSFCRTAQVTRSAEVLDAFERELRVETRLVVVSHVFWNTGVVAPIEAIREIARTRTGGRCLVLVDAAQAAGFMNGPIESDLYAFPAAKWCCGPAGVAALIVGPDARGRLRPVFGGWRGALVSEPDGAVSWRDDARRYEGGLPCHALYRGWEAAIRVQREWGEASARMTRAQAMCREAWSRLATMRDRQELPQDCLTPEPPEAGILTLRVPDPAAVALRLEAEGVYVRAMPYPESLRICTHYLTSESDLQRLTGALGRH